MGAPQRVAFVAPVDDDGLAVASVFSVVGIPTILRSLIAQYSGDAPSASGIEDIAGDDFARTVAGDWGTPSDYGFDWSIIAGAGVRYDVSGGAGLISNGGGYNDGYYVELPGANVTNLGDGSLDVYATLTLTTPGAALSYLGLGIGDATANLYALAIRYSGAAPDQYGIYTVTSVGPWSTIAGSAVNGLGFAGPYRVHLNITPTTLRGKIWSAASDEPATYQFSITGTFDVLDVSVWACNTGGNATVWTIDNIEISTDVPATETQGPVWSLYAREVGPGTLLAGTEEGQLRWTPDLAAVGMPVFPGEPLLIVANGGTSGESIYGTVVLEDQVG